MKKHVFSLFSILAFFGLGLSLMPLTNNIQSVNAAMQSISCVPTNWEAVGSTSASSIVKDELKDSNGVVIGTLNRYVQGARGSQFTYLKSGAKLDGLSFEAIYQNQEGYVTVGGEEEYQKCIAGLYISNASNYTKGTDGGSLKCFYMMMMSYSPNNSHLVFSDSNLDYIHTLEPSFINAMNVYQEPELINKGFSRIVEDIEPTHLIFSNENSREGSYKVFRNVIYSFHYVKTDGTKQIYSIKVACKNSYFLANYPEGYVTGYFDAAPFMTDGNVYFTTFGFNASDAQRAPTRGYSQRTGISYITTQCTQQSINLNHNGNTLYSIPFSTFLNTQYVEIQYLDQILKDKLTGYTASNLTIVSPSSGCSLTKSTSAATFELTITKDVSTDINMNVVWSQNSYSLTYDYGNFGFADIEKAKKIHTEAEILPETAYFRNGIGDHNPNLAVPTPTTIGGYKFEGWIINNLSNCTHWATNRETGYYSSFTTTSINPTDNKEISLCSEFSNLRTDEGEVTFEATYSSGEDLAATNAASFIDTFCLTCAYEWNETLNRWVRKGGATDVTKVDLLNMWNNMKETFNNLEIHVRYWFFNTSTTCIDGSIIAAKSSTISLMNNFETSYRYIYTKYRSYGYLTGDDDFMKYFSNSSSNDFKINDNIDITKLVIISGIAAISLIGVVFILVRKKKVQ